MSKEPRTSWLDELTTRTSPRGAASMHPRARFGGGPPSRDTQSSGPKRPTLKPPGPPVRDVIIATLRADAMAPRANNQGFSRGRGIGGLFTTNRPPRRRGAAEGWLIPKNPGRTTVLPGMTRPGTTFVVNLGVAVAIRAGLQAPLCSGCSSRGATNVIFGLGPVGNQPDLSVHRRARRSSTCE